MKVLMFGWEFPPAKNYGLGRVCYNLTKGLYHNNVDITLVLPKLPEPFEEAFLNLIDASELPVKVSDKVDIRTIKSILSAYIGEGEYSARLKHLIENGFVIDGKDTMYGANLFNEIERYASQAYDIAKTEDFDIIHAHDWMTARAGEEAKRASGKPFIMHVHSTEVDRSTGNPDPLKYDLERRGMFASDKIIAVSELTKKKIVEHYGIDPEKIEVIHNAVHEITERYRERILPKIHKNDKVVLFLGRLTIMKGPEYFLQAAKRVLEKRKRVKFVFVGDGDLMNSMINLAVQLGIQKHVIFAGALGWQDVDKAFQMANVYVMPSVTEPFGVVALESMKNGTPAIISKQSGVSEMIKNVLKVDFWDTDDMAEKILSILKYGPLSRDLKENAQKEVDKITWDRQSKKIADIYKSVVSEFKTDSYGS